MATGQFMGIGEINMDILWIFYSITIHGQLKKMCDHWNPKLRMMRRILKWPVTKHVISTLHFSLLVTIDIPRCRSSLATQVSKEERAQGSQVVSTSSGSCFGDFLRLVYGKSMENPIKNGCFRMEDPQ